MEAAPAERLYEQCSAASALCVRLTMAAQVYGGSLSLVVGAYLWSQSQQAYSTCNAGATVVSGLWTELNNIRISGSQAGTYTIGGSAFLPRNPTFRMHERLGTSLIVLTRFKRRIVVRLERASCAAIRLSRAPFQLWM